MGWAPKTREQAGRKPRKSGPRRQPEWDDEDYNAAADSRFPRVHEISQVGPANAPASILALPSSDAAIYQKVKSGKEADGYLARCGTDYFGYDYFVKQFIKDRVQANVLDYHTRGEFRDERTERAVASGSRYGARAFEQHWASREFDILCRLWDAGAAVPYPIGRSGLQLSLELIGTPGGVGQRLVDVKIDQTDSDWVLEQLNQCLRSLAALALVHADLSPYNLLVDDGRIIMIDFPQSVRFEERGRSEELLDRDLLRLAQWCERQGFDQAAVATAIGGTRRLWTA